MIYSIEKLVEMENTEREALEEAELNVNGEGSRGGGGDPGIWVYGDKDILFTDGFTFFFCQILVGTSRHSLNICACIHVIIRAFKTDSDHHDLPRTEAAMSRP